MKSALYPAVQQVLEQVNRVILGKSEEIREIMTTFLANGHVLLEDIPGVGKTTIAVAFSVQWVWIINVCSSRLMFFHRI